MEATTGDGQRDVKKGNLREAGEGQNEEEMKR
jgi:hypothetical protein